MWYILPCCINIQVFIESVLYVSETAINIGYSCQLLTDDMEEVFIIDAEDPAEVKKQLDDALKHIDDVKKGVKDRVDAEVNMGESFQDYSWFQDFEADFP